MLALPNTSDCNDIGYSAGSSITAIRRITDDLRFSDLELELGAIQQPFQLDTIKRAREEEPMKFSQSSSLLMSKLSRTMRAYTMYQGQHRPQNAMANTASILATTRRIFQNSKQRPEYNIAALKAKSEANAEDITFSIFEKDGKITLQALKQLFGRNLNDAANCLDADRSNHICTWHERKPTDKSITSVTHNSFGVLIGADKQVPGNSCPPLEQVVSSTVDVISRIPPTAALQNGESATVKARYREYFIKFQLSLSLLFAELENKVADRLKLKIGTFHIQYQDADDDWVLIACNDDLESCLTESRSLGNNQSTCWYTKHKLIVKFN
ncbi:hypothetical protein HAX54_000113 [Datura stramonium]|uniref:PB1 domain-containing protein n=1 Tax=Datura stramonium TaxID=4076 RepID=A0ABS8RHK3_DATST|nr:hypothetical protein [Datura stramonium]